MAQTTSTPLATGPLEYNTAFPDRQHSHAAERDDAVQRGCSDWKQDVLLKQPAIRDDFKTESSLLQDDTREDCLPFLEGTSDEPEAPTDFNIYGVPSLQRQLHVDFLHDSLQQLPSGFVAYDAARPWIIYWALLGLSLLGEDVSPYRER